MSLFLSSVLRCIAFCNIRIETQLAIAFARNLIPNGIKATVSNIEVNIDATAFSNCRRCFLTINLTFGSERASPALTDGCDLVLIFLCI